MTLEVVHDFQPVYDKSSRILILGSIPSAASRQQGFYYMHPQNRFWKVLERILDRDKTDTIASKKQMLLTNNIALWDVLASCNIEGSADSSIQSPQINDFQLLFDKTEIERVYTNGRKAHELYSRSVFAERHPAVYLPSTSPANAAYSLDRLCDCWAMVLQ